MKLPVVIITLFFVLCSAVDKVKEPRCNIKFKCLLVDDPVWATDGKKCYVFRNSCILANENCNRVNRCQPKLFEITKERCQTLCNPVCTMDLRPVCGYYNNEKREFSNQCMMDYYICSTGQTFMVYNEGPCEEPLILTDS